MAEETTPKVTVNRWVLTKRDKDPITGDDYLYEVKVGGEGLETEIFSLENGDDLSPWIDF